MGSGVLDFGFNERFPVWLAFNKKISGAARGPLFCPVRFHLGRLAA
jgi:hypothetical protein